VLECENIIIIKQARIRLEKDEAKLCSADGNVALSTVPKTQEEDKKG